MQKLTIARKVYFCCAHQYGSKKLSPSENRDVFGACVNAHGHDYTLEAFFCGSIDERTSLIVNLIDVDRILRDVAELLDHRFLNKDVEEFKTQVPTTENIARFCFENIQSRISKWPVELARVRLSEGFDLWVDYGPLPDVSL